MALMKWWGIVPLALILYAVGCKAAECNPACASVGATCNNDGMGNFNCTCNAGYTGNGTVCADYNECEDMPSICDMNADCTNTPGSHECLCRAGYTKDGTMCTDNEPPEFQDGTCPSDRDEVAEAGKSVKMVTWTNPSASDTTGVNPTVVCTPQSGSDFTIGTRDVVCTATDAAGNQATPNCAFTVTVTDYNECEDTPSICDMNADCTNTPGSHECLCRAGYTGDGTTCIECDEGMYGLNCALECSCVSRGTCNKVTGDCTCDPIDDFSDAVCDKDDFQVSLTRADGMSGPVLDTEANDDVELNCIVNVLPEDLAGSVLIRYPDGNDYPTTLDSNRHVYRKTIVNVHPRDSGDYTCLTQIQPRPSDSIVNERSIYRLTVEDLDECATNMFQCDINAYCVNNNMDGGYTCVCNPGYRFASDGVTCEDIDECTEDTDNCVMNASCTNTIGGFTCLCKPGYSGVGDVSCQVCMQGKYGLGCNEDCTCVAPVPGGNDVMCNNVDGTCSCDPEFTGKACDKSDLSVMLEPDPDPVLDTKGEDNVTLICSVNLHSRDLASIDITFKNGTQIKDTILTNTTEGMYERTLYDISLSDSAMYTCTATTVINGSLLTRSGDIDLDVLAPGRIISVTEKVEGELGDTVVVNCIVYADPAPNITWYDLNSMVIINDDIKYSVSSTTDLEQGRLTSSLTVKNLVRNDNGSYKCETQNELTDEKDQKFAEVVVIEVPEVGNVAASPVSSESIDVTWAVTFDGNLPFTCRVEYREAISGTWRPSTPNPPQHSLTHLVTGLEAFTFYSVRVTCNNRVGDGEHSMLDNPVQTKQAAPSAPQNPRVTVVTFESLTVAWDEPEMKRGTIAFYHVSVEGAAQPHKTSGNPAPRSLVVSGLNPFTDYTLVVTAFNIEGGVELRGENSVRITKKTAESTPTFPVNVKLNNTGLTCVVTWDRPREENGIILTYTISRLAHLYSTPGTQNVVDLIPDMEKTDEVEVTGDQRSYSVVKSDLQPYALYSFAITASTSVGKGSQSEMTVATCDSPPSAPPEPAMPMFAAVEERVTSDSFWMALENTSSTNGPISCYDIIVVRIEKDAQFNYTEINPDQQYPQDSIMTYDESTKRAGAYRAVVKNGKSLPEMLEIGVTRTSTCTDDSSSSSRKKRATPEVHIGDNGPLLSATRYSAFLRAFVRLDNGSEAFSSSPLMAPVTTASPIGIVVGVILAILIIIVIVLVVLIYIRRRKETPLLHDRENGFTLEPVMGHEKESEVTHMVVLPIPIEELPEKVKQKSENEDEVFKNEFKSIPESTGSVTRDASQLECNKEKNRYINITAYDQTRVKLLEISGVEGSDYINACYVDGYEKPKKFIAAQGPREDTVLDFWRMIWEQNCSTVIMLTKCLENGREKCAEYWPEEDAIMYDDIIVTLDDVVTCADYVIRKFTMQKSIEGEDEDDEPVLGESRILMQFHFLGWPDFGVPKYPHSLLCFIKRIRHMSGNRTDPGNTVIHCSAGVGRTGTYILIDSMLDMMKKEKKVDIYNVIYELRSQRNLLVQSLVQYMLIHKAIAEEYLFGHTEVDVGSLHILFQKLSKKDPDNDFTGLDQEYRTLASLPVENKDQKGGNIEANKHKNRLRQVIPYDYNRVKLERLTGQEHSNYINASFIDGYEHKKAYIAAQGPLPNTMGDFWRLAWENQCSTIVMMSACEEKGQSVCSKYWPEHGETVNHAFLTVTVKDEKEEEELTIRDLEVSTTKGGGTKLIRQYHFHGWPEVGSPESAASLIKVIGLVYDYQHDIGRFPILVHCSAGSGRTGVFIALSFLLQRAKAEGIVDIFQTVRSLRQQRPHMVQDVEQYQFCYRAMLEYLDSFDHYANFK